MIQKCLLILTKIREMTEAYLGEDVSSVLVTEAIFLKQ